jgi:DNA polymerase III subunit delta
MEADEIIAEIKAGRSVPIYLLHGEEPYFIDSISDFIQHHLLDAGQQVFNQRIFYGKDTDAKMVLDEASQYPLMSDKRLVLVKEGQDMKTLNQLESYLENPVPSTVLVLCYKYKKFDQRTKLAKLVKQNGISFESKRIYENQIPGWIQKEAAKKGLPLKPEAAELMAAYLGADLGSIQNNLDKIKISFPGHRSIGAEELQDIIGISKDFNVYELSNAIGLRDKTKVFQIIRYFAANPKANPIPVVLTNLYKFFSQLYIIKANNYKSEADLKRIFQPPTGSLFLFKANLEALKIYDLSQLEKALLYLREYDLKSKGVNTRRPVEEALLKELAIKILKA